MIHKTVTNLSSEMRPLNYFWNIDDSKVWHHYIRKGSYLTLLVIHPLKPG